MASEPVWFSICDFLEGRIRRGLYAVGEALPTDAELCEVFMFPRNPLRAAVGALRGEGWIEQRGNVRIVMGVPVVARELEESDV